MLSVWGSLGQLQVGLIVVGLRRCVPYQCTMSERQFEKSGMGLSGNGIGGDVKLECCQRSTENRGCDDG